MESERQPAKLHVQAPGSGTSVLKNAPRRILFRFFSVGSGFCGLRKKVSITYHIERSGARAWDVRLLGVWGAFGPSLGPTIKVDSVLVECPLHWSCYCCNSGLHVCLCCVVPQYVILCHVTVLREYTDLKSLFIRVTLSARLGFWDPTTPRTSWPTR